MGCFAKSLLKSLYFGIDLKDLTIFLTEWYRVLFVNEIQLHVGQRITTANIHI